MDIAQVGKFGATNGQATSTHEPRSSTLLNMTREIQPHPQLAIGQVSLKRKREGDEGYDPELERVRHLNDLKLKSRLEHIFSKYSRDFTDVGDEIDLVSGELVIDNGHLQHMRTECDLGGDRPGRLTEMLVAEVNSENGEEGWEDDDDSGGIAGVTAQIGSDDGEHDLDGVDDSEADNEASPTSDFITDEQDTCSNRSDHNDIWNDMPRLPGDVGYDPFAGDNQHAGRANNPLKLFQTGVSNQLEELVEALQKAQASSLLEKQSHGVLQPQITINLDPNSADYGKPVITYMPSVSHEAPASGLEQSSAAKRPTHSSKDESTVNHTRSVAARVLQRIADAGLPTIPGPNGKYPAYKSNRIITKPSNEDVRTIELQEPPVTSEHPQIPIDPALEALAAQVDAPKGLVIEDSPEAMAYLALSESQERTASVPYVPFTEDDDELILELRDNRGMAWEDIRALCFQDRRLTALQYRYYTYLKSDCSKDFTEEDDNLIIQLREVDRMTWPKIQRTYFSEYRISQLQYRYYTKLCPVREAPWTKEQDDLIAELKDEKGLKWDEIRRDHFPKKTLGQIQYRYYKNCRPTDWKEQLEAIARTHDKAGGQGGDDLEASLKEAENSKISGIQKRLAGASTKLTESKIKRHARMKEKRDEQARLEAARSLAQEKKRRAREAQTLAKLNIVQSAEPTTSRQTQLDHPEPEASRMGEMSHAATDGIGATTGSAAVLMWPTSAVSPLQTTQQTTQHPGRTVQQQLNDALARYDTYMNPQGSDFDSGTKHCETETDPAFLERQERDRKIFEQAMRMGPMLLPKPPQEARPSFPQLADNHNQADTIQARRDSYASPQNYGFLDPALCQNKLMDNTGLKTDPAVRKTSQEGGSPFAALQTHLGELTSTSSTENKRESLPWPAMEAFFRSDGYPQDLSRETSDTNVKSAFQSWQLPEPAAKPSEGQLDSQATARARNSKRKKSSSPKKARGRTEGERDSKSSSTSLRDSKVKPPASRKAPDTVNTPCGTSTKATPKLTKNTTNTPPCEPMRAINIPFDTQVETPGIVDDKRIMPKLSMSSKSIGPIDPSLRKGHTAAISRRLVKGSRRMQEVIADSETDASDLTEVDYDAVDLSGSESSLDGRRPGSRASSADSTACSRKRTEYSVTEDDSADELTAHKDLLKQRVLGMRASLAFVDANRARKETPKKGYPIGTIQIRSSMGADNCTNKAADASHESVDEGDELA